MPKSKGRVTVKKNLHLLLNNGYNLASAVNQLRKQGYSEKNLVKGIRAVKGMAGNIGGIMGQIKTRKGGVAMKSGKYVYVDDGKPPDRKQVARMNMAFKGRRTGGQRAPGLKKPQVFRKGKSVGVAKAMTQAFRSARNPNKTINSANTSSALITHIESIAGLESNGEGAKTPVIGVYSINPGLDNLFKWGGGVMNNWTRYRPVSITIQMTSVCSSTASGRWGVGFDYDPTDETVNTVTNVDSLKVLHSAIGDVKDHLFLSFNIPRATTRKSFIVRSGETKTPLTETDLGHIIFVLESETPKTTIGYVNIMYTFSMYAPNPRPPICNSYLITPTTYTTGNMQQATAALTEYAQDTPWTYSYFLESNVIQSILFKLISNISGMVTITMTAAGIADVYDPFAESVLSWPFTFGEYQTLTNSVSNELSMMANQAKSVAIGTFWISASAGDAFIFQLSGNVNVANTVTYLNIVLSKSSVNGNQLVPGQLQLGVRPLGNFCKTRKPPREELKYPDSGESGDDNESCDYSMMRIKQLEREVEALRGFNYDTASTKNKVTTSTQMAAKFKAETNDFLWVLMYLVTIASSQIIPPFTKHPTTPTVARPTIASTYRPTTTRQPTSFPSVSEGIVGRYSFGAIYHPNSTCLLSDPESITDRTLVSQINCTSLRFNHYGNWSGLIIINFDTAGTGKLNQAPILDFSFSTFTVYDLFSVNGCKQKFGASGATIYDVKHNNVLSIHFPNLAALTGVNTLLLFLLPFDFNSEYFSVYGRNGTWSGYSGATTLTACTGGTGSCSSVAGFSELGNFVQQDVGETAL